MKGVLGFKRNIIPNPNPGRCHPNCLPVEPVQLPEQESGQEQEQQIEPKANPRSTCCTCFGFMGWW